MPKQFLQNIPCLFTTEMEIGSVAILDMTRLVPPAACSPVELTCVFPFSPHAKNWWMNVYIFNILYMDMIETLSEICQFFAGA